MLAVGVAVLAATLVAARLLLVTPQRLGPQETETTTGIPGPVGERLTTFAGGFLPHGPDPVHIRAVRVTGLPRGLRLVGVYGLEGGPTGGSRHGDPDPRLRADLRPVTDMVLRARDAREAWGVVLVFEALAPGEWVTTGLDIDWKAGRYKGTTHYKYKFEMDVTA